MNQHSHNDSKTIVSIDHFRPLLLNIGLGIHDGDWNWKDISSPFSRIYYVTEGSAKLYLTNGTYDLKPEHLYFIPAFTVHTDFCEGIFSHYYLHIYEDQYPLGSLLDNFEMPVEIKSSPLDLALIQRLHELNPYMQLPHSNPTSYDNKKMLQESVSRNKHRTLSTRIESRGILYQLVSRFLMHSKPKVQSTDPRVQKTLNYINRNIKKINNLEELANQACLSKDHFIRIFKREMGESPLQYINRKKIERAQLILLTESAQVKNIAFELGYEDHSYFIRIFKKTTGYSPLEYRKKFSNL